MTIWYMTYIHFVLLLEFLSWQNGKQNLEYLKHLQTNFNKTPYFMMFKLEVKTTFLEHKFVNTFHIDGIFQT